MKGAAFQAWPLWLKVGAWYLLLGIITLYLCVEMCRMTGFTLFWVVGFEKKPNPKPPINYPKPLTG